MKIPINKKFWIFSAIIITLSLIGLVITGWRSLTLEVVSVFLFPAIFAILLLFMAKIIAKVVIVFKNFVTKKESFHFKNIIPHSISLLGVVVLTIFFYLLIVCSSLNSPRTKGPVGAIKSNMTNMRAQGELYFEANNSSYGVQKLASYETCTAKGTMFMEKSMKQGLMAIESNKSYKKGSMVCAIGQKGQSWAISTRFLERSEPNICLLPLAAIKDFFVTPKESSWCVDSSGRAGSSSGVETQSDGSVGCAIIKTPAL